MKYAIASILAVVSTYGFSLPSPGAFSNAEVQAVVAHQELKNWVLHEIKFHPEGELKLYDVRMHPGYGDKFYCQTFRLESRMAPPEGSARSSDKVIATALENSVRRECQ